jgi:hypothetical protein
MSTVNSPCVVKKQFRRTIDPESYASGRIATGRVSLAGQVEGDDPA